MHREDGYHKLLEALTRLELPFSIHKIIPFVGNISPDINPKGKVFVFGSYSLAYLANRKKWSPGAVLDNLDYEIQKKHWKNNMLNYDASIHCLEHVPFQKNPFFIRPTDDGKSFSGTIMDWGSFCEWKENILNLKKEDSPTLDKNTKVMICSKKQIYKEIRNWIVDGKVVTSSEYKIGTRIISSENVDDQVISFAQDMASLWSPNSAYCMDVADTSEGLKIVEINNLNSSGFYKADMNKLVIALEELFEC